MNHRNLIACLCLPPLMMAADFWQEKDPAQWTEKEITRLRTNSPWARDASVEFNMGRMGNSPGGPGGGPGGGGMGRGGGMGPGGGLGGPPPDMGSGGPGGMSSPKMIVRWESAAPLLEAEHGTAKTPVSEWAREFYVIVVSGLPAGGRRGGEEASGGQGGRNPMGPASMKEVTSLKRKNKDPIAPARVEMLPTSNGSLIAFLFPRTDPIDADDREVSFESGMGPLGIKCKFMLKAMTYHGKLAL